MHQLIVLKHEDSQLMQLSK